MITPIFASIIGFIYFYISRQTILTRRKQKVLFGSNDNPEVTRMISAHSNLTSYAPLFLILFFLLEYQGFNKYVLVAFGVLFITGRILHFFAMKNGMDGLKIRVIAMRLTLMPIMVLSVLNLAKSIQNLLS